MTDILNAEYHPLALTKARRADDPTQAESLRQAHGDLELAFQFACAAVNRLACIRVNSIVGRYWPVMKPVPKRLAFRLRTWAALALIDEEDPCAA